MSSAASEVLIFDKSLKEEKEYWIGRLSREVEPAVLLPDYEEEKETPAHRGSIQVHLSGEISERLALLAGGSQFLLYTALLTTLKICLFRYTGATTITIGSPALKRADEPTQKPNSLAIVDDLDSAATFRQTLLAVRETLLQAYKRQRYPFSRLLKDLGRERREHPRGLFDVAMRLDEIHGEMTQTELAFNISFSRRNDDLSGLIDFDAASYASASVERFRDHFAKLLETALREVDTPIRDLPMQTESERHRLLETWNDTETDYSRHDCIQHLFEVQVARTPDSTALVSDEGWITYSVLNDRAGQLANHLRYLGIGAESLVGVLGDRSIETVVGLLGVLKSGGAYVPLDPAYPKERLAFMLEDAGISVLLTNHSLAERVPPGAADVIYLDRDWDAIGRHSEYARAAEVTPANLAYVIYTSGSTGRPKGVLVQHQGLCNLVEAQIRAFQLRPESRVLQFASLSFDASVSEIFTTLIAGASLWLAQREELIHGPDLIGLLRDSEITAVTLPPSVLAILEHEELPRLHTLVVAGESCSREQVQEWGAGRRFLNAYGPTEITICATIAECREDGRGPSIGRPIANTRIYILDEDLDPVPAGARGEICISGTGVSRGYLKRPDLTAAHFVPDPFSDRPGERLYKSGDLARLRWDDDLDFLGRVDHQVKIRGYRVEPGEIEAALEALPEISRAVVVAWPDGGGNNRLVAYLIAAGPAVPQVTELRGALRERLPDHMCPSAIVFLDEIPLNANGKIDKRALPVPDHTRPALDQTYVSPRTPIEEAVAGIWADAFKLERVGIHDNFFDLGGHSLLATQVISKVRRVFGVVVSLRALFDGPTVAEMSEAIVQVQIKQADADSAAELLNQLESLSDEEVQQLLAQNSQD